MPGINESTLAAERGTLKKIKDEGTISIGYRSAAPPFSYLGPLQTRVGYSIDFAMKIVDAVKQRLNLPNLQVRYVPTTSIGRIPAVQNGSIDIECGSTTNNLARQKEVGFSNSIFVVNTRIMVPEGSNITDWADLSGKVVVTTAGTTCRLLLNQMNQSQGMGMRQVDTQDHDASVKLLQSGGAAAFVMDDALLAGLRMTTNRPDKYSIVGTPLLRQAYGCMMRVGDLDFKSVVDAAIAKVQTSGEADDIYKKWFASPIPPKGLNLNLPMSDDLKAIFKNPNDRTFD